MKLLRSLVLIVLPFVVFTIGSFIISQSACDSAMNLHAEKLLPFSHKSHLTKYGASDCELCHGYYDNGRFKGLPVVGDCKMCHDGGTATEKDFFKNYQDSDKPWTAWAKQPDLVYFSHMAVMNNNKKAQCASCHGNKESSMTTAKIKGKMPMGQCMDCHTSLNISNACAVCHD